MQVNIVKVSALSERGAVRFDAEFVNPDLIQLEQRLRELGATPLNEFFAGELPNNAINYGDNPEVNYIAIDDIDDKDGFVFHQSIAKEELPSRAKHRLQAFDVVVSNVRPERGGVGLVLPSQLPALGSSGLSVVRVADQETQRAIFAFLRSSFARGQLVRRSRGSMYPAVTKEDVGEILIPHLPKGVKTAVAWNVEQSLEKREEFLVLNELQTKSVEKYLRETLGDPPPDIVMDIAEQLPVKLVTRSELFAGGADRFDAEFHRKEFVEFQERLKDTPGVVRLGSLFHAFAGGNPGKGTDTVFRLRQAQLSGFGISFGGCEEIDSASAAPKSALRHSDVLIGCTAHEPHYVGNRVDLVDDLPEELQGKVIPVPDVMIIRARQDVEANPAFLASFLRTQWGRRQFQRLNRGVRGGHVYGQDVEAFIYIPRPSSDWMTTFEDRQNAIRTARRASIAALNTAVHLLEHELA